MTDQELIEMCAAAALEANRQYSISIGDPPLLPWDQLGETPKDSYRQGVVFALAGSTPESQHDNWRYLKIQQGWQYGPYKDEVQKLHPCLTAYANLTEEQRYKDKLFIDTVLATATANGWTPAKKKGK